MKESVESKLRFNNNLTFWSLFAMVVVVFLSQLMINIDLRIEIDSMPHYECWNETFEDFINKTDTQSTYISSQECKIFFKNNKAYQSCELVETYHSGYSYKGLEAKCSNDSNICYVSGEKEVCKLNRDVLRDK